MFNIQPTAKVIWRRGHGLESHLKDLESQGLFLDEKTNKHLLSYNFTVVQCPNLMK